MIKLLSLFIRNRIEGHAGLRGIAGNAGWLLLDKIVRMGIGLLVNVWVARYLGPERYGALNFAVAFSALFTAIATLGVDGIVVRDIVREPDRKDTLVASAFALKLTGGAIAFLAALLGIFLLRPEDGSAHALVGIIAAGMIFQAFDVLDLWFQSQVQSKFTVIAKNAAFLVLAAVKVALISAYAPLEAFAWAAFTEVVLGAAGMVLLYARTQSFSQWRIDWTVGWRILRESWPLILSGLTVMIYMRIDQIMLAEMIGNAEVGLYSAALRFSEVWYFIPTVIVSSVTPALTRASFGPPERYGMLLHKLFGLLAGIAYLIAIPMTFIAPLLMTTLYGDDFARSGTILTIHIWTAVFVFLGVGRQPWVVNKGLMKHSLYQTFLGALVNIGLNLFLIRAYGGAGAAIATLISQMIASVGANALFPETRIIFKMQMSALFNPLKELPL